MDQKLNVEAAPVLPKGSFAEQVKSVTSTQAYKNPDAELMVGPADFDNVALPKGEPQKTEAEKLAEATPAAVPAESAPTVIKFRGKEFASMESALQFAAEETAKAEGMREAVDKLSPKEQAQVQEQAVAWEKEIEDLIFVDPALAIKKIYEKAKSDTTTEVFEKYGQMKADEAKAQSQNTAYEKYKKDFMSTNSDLADAWDTVEYVMEKNWADLQDMPLDKSTSILADKTRALLKITKQATAPKLELPSGPARVASPGGPQVPVVQKVEGKEPLAFIAQLNKIRKRG